MEEDFKYCSKEHTELFIQNHLSDISYDLESGNVLDSGFIYLIDFGDGKTKIGLTKLDPYKRLKQLSTTGTIMPFELSLIALGYCDQVRCVEKMLHTQFRYFRHSGEWFDFSGNRKMAQKLLLIEELHHLANNFCFCDGWEKWKPDDDFIKVYSKYPINNENNIDTIIEIQKNENKYNEETKQWIESVTKYAV